VVLSPTCGQLVQQVQQAHPVPCLKEVLHPRLSPELAATAWSMERMAGWRWQAIDGDQAFHRIAVQHLTCRWRGDAGVPH